MGATVKKGVVQKKPELFNSIKQGFYWGSNEIEVDEGVIK